MIENTVILLMCKISLTIKTTTLVSDGKTFSQFDFTELLYRSADTDFPGCRVTFLNIYYWQNHQGNKCSTASPLVLCCSFTVAMSPLEAVCSPWRIMKSQFLTSLKSLFFLFKETFFKRSRIKPIFRSSVEQPSAIS